MHALRQNVNSAQSDLIEMKASLRARLDSKEHRERDLIAEIQKQVETIDSLNEKIKNLTESSNSSSVQTADQQK